VDTGPIDHSALAPHVKLAVASLCGGVLRLLFRPAKGQTMREALLKSAWLLFGCVTCGYYFTPVVMNWWRFDESYSGAVGALIGFVGLSIAEGILKGVDGFNIGNLLRFFIKDGVK
jgi:hypothetical protein